MSGYGSYKQVAEEVLNDNNLLPANVLTVVSGQSVQAKITEAVAAGASTSIHYDIVAYQGAIMDQTAPIPVGIRIIDAGLPQALRMTPAPRVPYQSHMIAIVLARGARASYMDVPAGNPYGSATSAAMYLAAAGIPITHAILGGKPGSTDVYGDVKATFTLNELRYITLQKGDSVISATKNCSYGDLRLPAAFWDEVLNDRARIEAYTSSVDTAPTGFVTLGVDKTASAFLPLGLRCYAYSEGGAALEAEPYGQTPGHCYEHRMGWYQRGLEEVFGYGWMHGATTPNGNVGLNNKWHMYRSVTTEQSTPSVLEEKGRSLFVIEEIYDHAAFKTLIDAWVTARAAGTCDFVSYDTLARGIRETGPDKVITGEVLVVASDTGTLRRVPKQVLAIHGTVGATSTVFTVVPAARTLATGEVHVNYTTGALTFYADDDPTSVTVDYLPVPAWGGLKEWDFSGMSDGDLANSTGNQYGWYKSSTPGSIASNKLVLATGELAHFQPSIVPGATHCLRIKANADSATAGLVIRVDMQCYVMINGVATTKYIEWDFAAKTITAAGGYYYWYMTIPTQLQNLSFRLRNATADRTITITSAEWAIA